MPPEERPKNTVSLRGSEATEAFDLEVHNSMHMCFNPVHFNKKDFCM